MPTSDTPRSSAPTITETAIDPTTATSTLGTAGITRRSTTISPSPQKTDSERSAHGVAGFHAVDERARFGDEAVGVGREAEQLGVARGGGW